VSTETLTLTDFLLARIAEDEGALAQVTLVVEDGGPFIDFRKRVLAECEAKRAIIEEHPMMSARLSRVVVLTGGGQPAWLEGACSTCTAGGEYGGCDPVTGELSYCETLRALAAIWSDHPDYPPK
jgi:hypothetical protein